ncbi:MAG TPA: hypothetical protein PLT92_01910 [Ignavibacteriaceae bacterium]|nr:hypothetical protein [Ignavibacteriaceae bacterium]
MKKLILKFTKYGILLSVFSTALLFTGCVKEFDSVVDVRQMDFKVTYVGIVDSFTFIPGDSVIFIRLGLNNPAGINKITAEIYSPDNKRLQGSPVELFDDGNSSIGDFVKGDGVYSQKFPFSQFFPNGVYRIEYFSEDKYLNNYKVAVKSLNFNNGQSNIPPVVSNLQAPDTAFIGQQTTVIKLTLDVLDSNGQNDIESVFFNSFIPPNGNPSSGNPFIMYDDGTNGDDTAGDGKYTVLVQLPATGVTKGVYRWEFQARDRGKKLSNVIIHNIYIL